MKNQSDAVARNRQELIDSARKKLLQLQEAETELAKPNLSVSKRIEMQSRLRNIKISRREAEAVKAQEFEEQQIALDILNHIPAQILFDFALKHRFEKSPRKAEDKFRKLGFAVSDRKRNTFSFYEFLDFFFTLNHQKQNQAEIKDPTILSTTLISDPLVREKLQVEYIPTQLTLTDSKLTSKENGSYPHGK